MAKTQITTAAEAASLVKDGMTCLLYTSRQFDTFGASNKKMLIQFLLQCLD